LTIKRDTAVKTTKDNVMTILKNILLSLAVIPVTISMSFAQSENNIKSQSMMQAQIIQPMAAQENRVIKRRDAKAMASVTIEQVPPHDETSSRCYWANQNNVVSIEDVDGCVGIASDSAF